MKKIKDIWISKNPPASRYSLWFTNGSLYGNVNGKWVKITGGSSGPSIDSGEIQQLQTEVNGLQGSLSSLEESLRNLETQLGDLDEFEGSIEIEETEGADLEFCDERGNVVLRIANGHLYSKYFSSEGGGVSVVEKDSGIKKLNMLFIGNSYSEDCLGYMPMLLQDIVPGFEINLVIAHYSGAKPSQQVDTLNNNYSNYIVYCYDGATKRWSKTHNNASCAAFRNMYRWDVVGYVGFYGDIWENDSRTPSYAVMPYVPQIFDWCRANIPGSWRTAYVLPPPFPKASTTEMETQHAAMRANAKRMMECTEIDDLIPCGTAIQNLRKTSPTIAAMGAVSSLTDDGIHLAEGLPVLTTSYVATLWALKLIGATTKTIRGNEIRPTVEWMDKHELPTEQRNSQSSDPVMGITEQNVEISQKCALAAFKNPYEANMVY